MRQLAAKSTYHFRILLALLVAGLLAGSLAPVEPAEAAFPGNNGKISFVVGDDGEWDIYVMDDDPATSDAVNLTQFKSESEPAFSSDGGKIVFSSFQNNSNGIYVMNADGTGTPVSLGKGSDPDFGYSPDPAFSPDGTSVVFIGGDQDHNPEVFVMNAQDTDGDGNGDNLVQLTSNGGAQEENHPSFSPDGTKVVFSADEPPENLGDSTPAGIYVMDTSPATNDATNLTNNSADDVEPNFSPDGTEVAFSSDRDGDYEIYTMDIDAATNDASRLTNNASLDDRHPAFSPDGEKIAFSAPGLNGNAIYTMDTEDTNGDGNGENLANLTDELSTVGPDNAPDWGVGAAPPPDGECTITGTPGDDVIDAAQSPGNDVICGLGGDDQIDGGSGNDTIRGGPGRDTMTGGAGDDELRGGEGRDNITDRTGKDKLFGGQGRDELDSKDGTGGDRLDGKAGNDTCRADKGDIKQGC